MTGRYTVDAYELRDWDGIGHQLVDFYADGVAVGTFFTHNVTSWMDAIDAGRTVNLLVNDDIMSVVE